MPEEAHVILTSLPHSVAFVPYLSLQTVAVPPEAAIAIPRVYLMVRAGFVALHTSSILPLTIRFLVRVVLEAHENSLGSTGDPPHIANRTYATWVPKLSRPHESEMQPPATLLCPMLSSG